MSVQVGERVEMKKPHPCGGKTFEILRVGIDFKIRCLTDARSWLRVRKSRKTSEKSSENSYVRKDRNI